MSCAFSTTLFLSNTPGAFAKNTLSSPLAETPHRSAATGRFRVLWCHTRELCRKNMKISRNHVVKPHTPSTELIRTSQNFWFLLPRPKGADEARRIRACDLVSSHHARGACDIICFESKCELGTIET